MKLFKSKKPTETVISKIEANGTDFLDAIIERQWDIENLTVDNIRKYEDDFFVQMVYHKLSGYVFVGPYIINVVDKEGNSREDVAQWLRPMLIDLNFGSVMEASYHDLCVWGNYLHSIGLSKDSSGNISISEIRRLPPSSFDTLGTYETNYDYIQGKLLKGISIDGAGNTRYWQRNTKGDVIELKNCEHYKSKITTDYIDGTPVFNPIYKLVPKLTFLVDGMMIANNRDNIMFIRPSTTDPESWKNAQAILKGVSRTLRYILFPGSEIIEPSRPVSDFSLKSLDVVVKWVMSMYSSTDLVSKGDSTLVGGSDRYAAELTKNFSKGQQRLITEIWSGVLNNLLYMNGYFDLKVELLMEELSFNNEELNLKIGTEILSAAKEGVVIASINEVRNKFKLEDADDRFLQNAQAEWERSRIVRL